VSRGGGEENKGGIPGKGGEKKKIVVYMCGGRLGAFLFLLNGNRGGGRGRKERKQEGGGNPSPTEFGGKGRRNSKDPNSKDHP